MTNLDECAGCTDEHDDALADGFFPMYTRTELDQKLAPMRDGVSAPMHNNSAHNVFRWQTGTPYR